MMFYDLTAEIPVYDATPWTEALLLSYVLY